MRLPVLVQNHQNGILFMLSSAVLLVLLVLLLLLTQCVNGPHCQDSL